jgi:hypothetical protein
MSDDQQTPNEQDTKTVQGQKVDVVNGVACPIDPQALLECESCQ